MQQTTNTFARPINLTVCVRALGFAHRIKKMIGEFQIFFSLRFLYCYTFVGRKPISFLIFHMWVFSFAIRRLRSPQTVESELHVVGTKHINNTI